MMAPADETAAPLASALVRAGWPGRSRRIALSNGPAPGSLIALLDRRAFLAILGGSLLAAPLAAEAQQVGKDWRIGILGSVDEQTLQGEFVQGLRELGYVEGKNTTIERRYSQGRDERLPDLAAELVRLNVHAIVATGGSPPYAAKRATSTIPIVFSNNGDPVGSGLVASLGRPGGNVTGLSLVSPEIVGKRLQLLKEALPGISRFAILSSPSSPMRALSLKEAEVAARPLHVQLRLLEAQAPRDLASAFSTATKERIQALMVLGGPMFYRERAHIADLATKSRLPAIAAQREYAEVGCLMTYGANLRENYRRAAIYVDRILKGAKPADLPVEQPTKFELVINLKTAKALGLTIPPSLLQRVDQVIE
jgi:ABC-type uncharacterized transport system substrate-binding protein